MSLIYICYISSRIGSCIFCLTKLKFEGNAWTEEHAGVFIKVDESLNSELGSITRKC